MPAPTFIVRNAAGAVVFDASVATFGCVADVVAVASGASATYTYPVFAGKTILALQAHGERAWAATIDYALGYPRVIFGAVGSDRTIVIFAF